MEPTSSSAPPNQPHRIALHNPPVTATDSPHFNKEKHISYWLRCLRTPLPHQYTSTDANRMTLAFFTVSALDLLGALFTRTTAAERDARISWIYSCQHPEGGFRGFPGTDFGSRRSPSNALWDPANLPATYFALAALSVLRDDLARVRRVECLSWLTKMQRADGSFGQTLGEGDGRVEGGMDTRFAYCAMVVRWILRGNVEENVDGQKDVDAEALVRRIRSSETYDGGISEEPFQEAHAGFTYCAIGALSFLHRLPPTARLDRGDSSDNHDGNSKRLPGISSASSAVRWLMSRLTSQLEEDFANADHSEDEDGEDDIQEAEISESSRKAPLNQEENMNTGSQEVVGGRATSTDRDYKGDTHPTLNPPRTFQWLGFNGRANKLADTCYVFWAGASLKMLDSLHLAPLPEVRRYLLEKTQHFIAGGFGKLPGDPPDMYHAYLGLAALSLLETEAQKIGILESGDVSLETSHVVEEMRGGHDAETQVHTRSGLLELDAALCFSVRARRWVEQLR